MSAFVYILLTRFKNKIISLVKSPGTLIAVIILIAVLLIPTLTSSPAPEGETDFRDIREVYAMMMVLYCAVFVMTGYNGLSKGASLYTMPDVNLVFASPISSKKVLFYGLIQQMGTSLLIGLFLLFQYAWMHSSYGISLGTLALILVGYAISIFCGQLVAMILYSYTTGNEKKSRAAKAFLLALSGLAVLYLLISVYPQRGQWLTEAVSVLNDFPFIGFPVGGWAQMAISGILEGQWVSVLTGLSILLGFTAVLVALMARGEADYYEDVLQATEVSFSAVIAGKQGRIDSAIPGKVKVGRTGIGKGFGPDSFYYKHRLESRRARVFLLDRNSLIFALVCIAFAIFVRDLGIVPIFAFACYMQIFSVALGRWIRELLLPYVYLLPEPPFIKLVHCLRESLLRILADALVLFLPIALLLHLSPMETGACILARISYGLLFTAGNIVVQRFFSGLTIKLLSLLLYFIVMVLLVLPGVGVAAILTMSGLQLLPGNLQIFLVLSLFNLLLTFVATFISRNMLEYSELNFR